MRWQVSGAAVAVSSGALLAGTVAASAGALLAGAATVPRVCAAVGLQAEAPQRGDATAEVRAAETAPYRPARLRTGAVPSIPVQAVGAGQVYLDLAVTSGGAVSAVRTLRVTPPFTESLAAAVAAWRFRPAEEEEPVQKPESAGASSAAGQSAAPMMVRRPVASRVLVAGWFRPPTLNTPSLGTPPQDVAAGSEEAPFPVSADMPAYPPLARDSGAVLVEAHVDRAGRVDRAAIVRSRGVFDVPALEAARRWTFRPARVKGALVGAYVYLVFGFRQPVTTK